MKQLSVKGFRAWLQNAAWTLNANEPRAGSTKLNQESILIINHEDNFIRNKSKLYNAFTFKQDINISCLYLIIT